MALTYFLLAVPTLLAFFYSIYKRPKDLPPGPKGRLFIGNVSDLMLVGEEKARACVGWFEEYGSIMHLQIFGRHTIILNSAQATSDLMDKRAAIYSHRPRMPMSVELAGQGWLLSAASGEPHRERRALAQRYFVSQIKDWQSVQTESCRALLRNLFATPDDWIPLLHLSIASSTLRISYGYDVTRTDDVILKVIMEAVKSLPNGPYLVDVFPLLKYYPSWLPGGQFHRDAAEAKALSLQVRDMPFNIVCDEMASGKARPSFVATLLSQLAPGEDIERSHEAELIRDTAAIIYGAAVDSTVSFMHTFLGTMVLYPDVQLRAHTELDSILSQDQLPTFDDRPSLPFIDSIVLEVFRWNVVTPLGFAHMVTQDDEYLGYRIPKGSTVMGNMWAILRDPMTFPNPDNFDPSRFLAGTEGSAAARKVTESTVFGWGKRTCPGRHVGHSALFLMISHILACFEICKPVDDAGNEFEPTIQFDESSFARRALPTPCRFRVRRSERIAALETRE